MLRCADMMSCRWGVPLYPFWILTRKLCTSSRPPGRPWRWVERSWRGEDGLRAVRRAGWLFSLVPGGLYDDGAYASDA